MAKKRRERSPSGIKLAQPDRSGPSKQTLLDMAMQRGLFDQAQKKQEENEKAKRAARKAAGAKNEDDNEEEEEDEDAKLPPTVERILETLLWTVSLSMLHFTLDVLVQHQYSIDRIVWPKVWVRTGQAFLVFSALFYTFHAHASEPNILPGLPKRFQPILRQAIFFVTSIWAGCYLIHITNTVSYLAVMKQAPSVGCLWVWSVIELDLPWAVLSLAGAGSFLWAKGYGIK
ncbi:hypothetical protein B0T17DRAFT_485738 [Bombardia bombarda]|uniref:DUF7719 domain-containing protein n=1 Tax=Bombardia bombarda TaxID=252184 RepID=A0AA39XNQ9_9PEZI|nr:hypothetical protein B0T17DRAFT_485738 [Bombardia bombarda]